MPSTADLVEKLRQKAQNLRGGEGGPRFNYVKMDSGDNVFRVINPTDGPLIQFYKRHRGRAPGGGFSAKVDLTWLISDEECLEAMLEREKISEHDIELITDNGDPYDILWRELNAAGKSDTFRKAGIGQKRSTMVILMEGDDDFGILDMGITFGENIINLLADNPNIVDWDEGMPLKVTATGEGLKRRYGAPVPIMSKQGPVVVDGDPIDPEDIETPNLYDVIAANCLSYPQKVQFLKRSHRPLMEEVGLEITDFGISPEDMAESFQYGANAEEEDDEE